MKKNNNIIDIRLRHKLCLWLSSLFFILSLFTYIGFSQTIVPISFINDQLYPIISGITFVVLIVATCLFIFSLINYKKLSNSVRFNYSTFALIDGILSENEFLSIVKRYIKKSTSKNNFVIVFTPSRFKKVVFSRYGYEKGSEVFQLVYNSFNTLKQDYNDLVYGYDYNDTFLLFIKEKTMDEVKILIERLEKIISEELDKEGIEVRFNSDYGVSNAYNDQDEKISAESMLQRALIASEHGRNDRELGSVTIYDSSMFEQNKRNVQLAMEIEKGIEFSQFVLHYQPKFDLKLNRFIGAEVLLRWQHPELGLLSPANFILFAEQTDLIIKLDQYVITKTCEQLAAWRGQGKRLLPLSINISKQTLFAGNIVNYILKETERYEVNPMLLEIEIVESPSLQDILLLLSIVKKFKDYKIKVSIDDFGTGYSSLSYIKKIPFDVIKIDKAFLDDVDIDQKSRLVIKNIIDLAHILDAYVIIEGVQDEKQVKMLTAMGADAIQGFYYSRPLDAEKYQTFLEENFFEMKQETKKGGRKK